MTYTRHIPTICFTKNIVDEKENRRYNDKKLSIFIRLLYLAFKKWKKYRRINSKIFQCKFAYPKTIIKTIYIYTYLTEIYVNRQGEGERERRESLK